MVLKLSLVSLVINMLVVFGFFTIFVQVELWGTPTHVSNGTDNRQTIRQLLLVLVMMVFQQRFSHLLSQLVSNGWVYLLVVQDHVWSRNLADGMGPNVVTKTRCSYQNGKPKALFFLKFKLFQRSLKPSPAISSIVLALMSSSTVPLKMQLRSSNRLCNDSVATYGLLHRSPPSSTSSSNFSHL